MSWNICLDNPHLPGMNGANIHNVGQNAQFHDGDGDESGSSVILLSQNDVMLDVIQSNEKVYVARKQR